jgi:hypothetical protein
MDGEDQMETPRPIFDKLLKAMADLDETGTSARFEFGPGFYTKLAAEVRTSPAHIGGIPIDIVKSSVVPADCALLVSGDNKVMIRLAQHEKDENNE